MDPHDSRFTTSAIAALRKLYENFQAELDDDEMDVLRQALELPDLQLLALTVAARQELLPE
jgi:hypothetical protein